MRGSPFAKRAAGGIVLAMGLASPVGCGSGAAQVRLGSDGGDAVSRPDAMDAARDAPTDAADVHDGADTLADVARGDDMPVEVEAGQDALRQAEVEVNDAADAPVDLPVEKPPATATWTIVPSAMCTAAGAGCMDTGAVGGYQITASGSCPAPSGVQLWFPGGAVPLAAGTYAVKPTAGILDVISMPAGMVGVLAERDDPTARARFKYWGRAGSVTVTAAGASRHVTFSGVSLREETSGVATTLAADVTCP